MAIFSFRAERVNTCSVFTVVDPQWRSEMDRGGRKGGRGAIDFGTALSDMKCIEIQVVLPAILSTKNLPFMLSAET